MADVFYFNTWYRGHNNARYEELLPRLERVDARLLTFPRGRVARGVAERAWRVGKSYVEPRVLRALERRYPYALVTDLRQLAGLHVPAVVDVDDSDFTPSDVALLRRAAAYVVTAESTGRRFDALGVDRPWHVVPQGVALESLGVPPPRPPEPRVGYLAAFLLLPGDRGGGDPLYDVSHLLELWEEIRSRVPAAVLELAGAPSRRLRECVASRKDIRLVGRVDRPQLMRTAAQWTVALYPRQTGRGIRASKTAEYLGAGVPIVSYDYDVVRDVEEAGAGLLVATPREFVSAVEAILRDPARHESLAAAARAEGARRDWRTLAARFAEILDEHLPALD